ncbi:hypothetical protein [Dolichospermum sp. UHCC 0299]|nr:hypothetical protein [Dolichospermum sp. UHCC 0299]
MIKPLKNQERRSTAGVVGVVIAFGSALRAIAKIQPNVKTP